jgi:ABC-2 type transport system permease protein
LKLYFEVAKRSFQRTLTYRAAAVAGVVTNIFFGLLRVAILLALYGDRQVVEGYTVAGVITYTGLSQAVIAYLSLFGWYDFMYAVHRGEVAADLLKPMNLFSFWLAQDLGRAVASLLLRGVTIMLIYEVFFDLVYPATIWAWLALMASLILSWLVSFAWRFLVNMAAFWSPNAQGLGRFAFLSVLFFSGFLMPLAFFPAWVQRLASLTPFPYLLNTVVEIYLGIVSGPALVKALLLQAAWALGLIVLVQAVLRFGLRRLVILGG